MSLWPGLTALVLATRHGLFLHALCVPILTLACGAFLTSFGLAVAARVEQFSRAVLVGVSAYLGVSVGWCSFMLALSSASDSTPMLSQCLACAAPWFHAGFTVLLVQERHPFEDFFLCGSLFWIAAYALAARYTFALLNSSFD